LIVGLSGCAAELEPTPTVEPPTALDPADFATQFGDTFGEGVDFDSVDGNVHCGIWAEVPNYDDGSVEAYAGGRPQEADYQADPSSTYGGEVGCAGGQLRGAAAPEPVCNGGLAFVGEGPMDGPVGVLPVGSAMELAGFTCTSPDEGTIECIRDAD